MSWEAVKLGDVLRLRNGYAFKSTDYADDGIPLIRISDINGGIVSTKRAVKIPEGKVVSGYFVDEGDILIAMSGATTGKYGIYKAKESVLQNQRVGNFRITDSDRLDKKYLIYIIEGIKPEIEKKAYGGAQPNISSKMIEEIEIKLPPLPEQHRIVAKIEELFRELDAGVESLKKAKEQLKTYRQAVLKAAFEGKLTGDKIRFNVIESGEIMDTINNGYTPKANKMNSSGDIPFIKVYNLTFDGSLDFSYRPTFISSETHKKELKRSQIYPGDVLINIVGPPLGKVSIVTNLYKEWNTNQAVVLLRPNEKIVSKYLSYQLQSPQVVSWLTATSQATAGQFNVRVSTCRIIPLKVCSVEEQDYLVNEIESRLSVCDNMEQTIEYELKQSESLRQSILKRAFEGRLVN